VTAKQSQSSGLWVFAWLVGGAFLGGALGALIAYLTYTPSDAPLDPDRAGAVELLGGFGLFLGLMLGFVGFRFWWLLRPLVASPASRPE
jgi:hypothetical protein